MNHCPFGQERDPRIACRTPVLEAVAGQLEPSTLTDSVVVAILHFLKDLPPFVDQLERIGMTRANAFFVPIVYSCREYVQRTLEQEGWRVYAAPAHGPPFNLAVRSALTQAIEQAERTCGKVLILEDGGYAVPMLLREFTSSLDLVIGAVEQTANGCWRDRDALRHYKRVQRGSVPFPISTVGWSPLKKAVESLAVADAILQGVERLLMRDHKGLRGKRVAVMGFGSVGKRVAEAVADRGARVSVYDRDQQKLVEARNQGFDVPAFRLTGIIDVYGELVPCQLDEIPQTIGTCLDLGESVIWRGRRVWPRLEPDLASFVRQHTVILGTSGHCSVGKELIPSLQTDTFLASCSSKRLEIDVVALETQAKAIESLEGIGTRYLLRSHNGEVRTITLLADGFPVNFWGDDAESIPTEHIEFVWALMMSELDRIVKGKIPQTGLCDPDLGTAQQIALMYMRHTSR